MTFISDLASRAIAFITAIQTALVTTDIDTTGKVGKDSILTIAMGKDPAGELKRIFTLTGLRIRINERAQELVLTIFQENKKPKPGSTENILPYNVASVNHVIHLSANLVEWISSQERDEISSLNSKFGNFPAPYNWRLAIEKILYEEPKERIKLAVALQYLPIQIVLALGGAALNARGQRNLQIWNPEKVDENVLFNLIEKSSDTARTDNVNWLTEFNCLLNTKNPLTNSSQEYREFLSKREIAWNGEIAKLLETKKEKKETKQLAELKKREKDQTDPDLNDEERKLMSVLQFKTDARKSKKDKFFASQAALLLLNQSALKEHLVIEEVPLSFELIFSEELAEIKLNREKRLEEKKITESNQSAESDVGNQQVPDQESSEVKESNDPFEKAQQMGILALAISGGGIRSATFNLGILQGFAEHQLIGKFDYLSTVSGGGYIGSWLTTWIKRNRSVVKVSNRLDSYKSPDPSGAELKPIKWLRMYSNYFAPNASMMSLDSWTVGITWLRNTLLNQLVIFLLFLTVLFAGNVLYQLWTTYLLHILTPTPRDVLFWSILSLLPIALLSGLGMSEYDKKEAGSTRIGLIRILRTTWKPPLFKNWKYKFSISQGIVAYTIIASYFVSAWLSSNYVSSASVQMSVEEKFVLFLPAAILGFLCLLIVSYLGNYTKYIKDFQKSTFSAILIILLVTLISALIGWVILTLVSVFLERMSDYTFSANPTYIIDKRDLQFIFGIPILIEVFVIAIIARMALLGKFFPDERREWWGRMGADIHRICFIWILVFTSALLGWKFIQFGYEFYGKTAIAATGGWIGLVGICVKAAFSSKSADTGESKGGYATFLNILSMAGPYLFILGLLILLPALTRPLLHLLEGVYTKIGLPVPAILFQNLCVMIVGAIATLALAMVLGVNEFSMYNFYKNRLVRAYLGSARRSSERQKTANPYTGFDMKDDELLYKYRHAEGYHGPYHIINCALNATEGQELDRQDRKAESFIFSPLFCGFDFSMSRDPDDKDKSYDYAFRETKQYAFKNDGPFIGTAMAISGAAVNPNMGYNSSPPIAFLLTVFNAQMGRWIGNPRKGFWQKPDPSLGLTYIVSNLINKSTTRDKFVSLSDGGHFDNMGLYEMVRRKCPFIILCDAEEDNQFTCEGLANAIRRCRIDFGAEITIDISSITQRTEGRFSSAHYALGTITYVGKNQTGHLLYIKSSITGNEPVDVFEYALKNKSFPHQPTKDQFFDEEQFETYRKLGLHIAREVMADKKVIDRFKIIE